MNALQTLSSRAITHARDNVLASILAFFDAQALGNPVKLGDTVIDDDYDMLFWKGFAEHNPSEGMALFHHKLDDSSALLIFEDFVGIPRIVVTVVNNEIGQIITHGHHGFGIYHGIGTEWSYGAIGGIIENDPHVVQLMTLLYMTVVCHGFGE